MKYIASNSYLLCQRIKGSDQYTSTLSGTLIFGYEFNHKKQTLRVTCENSERIIKIRPSEEFLFSLSKTGNIVRAINGSEGLEKLFEGPGFAYQLAHFLDSLFFGLEYRFDNTVRIG